jgi:hypothetical protein
MEVKLHKTIDVTVSKKIHVSPPPFFSFNFDLGRGCNPWSARSVCPQSALYGFKLTREKSLSSSPNSINRLTSVTKKKK